MTVSGHAKDNLSVQPHSGGTVVVVVVCACVCMSAVGCGGPWGLFVTDVGCCVQSPGQQLNV